MREDADYSYHVHPEKERTFQIFCTEYGDTFHVGDYALIDMEENVDLTERTVHNLCALLNDDAEDLVDVSELATMRLYFNRQEADEDTGWSRMLMKTHPQGRAMTENALITYDPEYINPAILSRLCGTRDGGSGMRMPKADSHTGIAPSFDPSFEG